MRTNWVWSRRLALALALCTAAVLSGCDDDDDDGVDDIKNVTGVVLSVLNGGVQANREFAVFDLAQPADAAPVASGTSDSNGEFSFSLKGIDIVFVAFPPVEATAEPRSSGLVFLDAKNNQKQLEDFTDVACVAGVSAVRDGSIAAAQLDDARIANLEAGAQQVIEQDGVDFTNADSVNAAVAKVREITNDGANPPQG
ncbi:MAG: hypothetical protein AB1651_00035 [Pseudomonadota bacterium]